MTTKKLQITLTILVMLLAGMAQAQEVKAIATDSNEVVETTLTAADVGILGAMARMGCPDQAWLVQTMDASGIGEDELLHLQVGRPIVLPNGCQGEPHPDSALESLAILERERRQIAGSTSVKPLGKQSAEVVKVNNPMTSESATTSAAEVARLKKIIDDLNTTVNAFNERHSTDEDLILSLQGKTGTLDRKTVYVPSSSQLPGRIQGAVIVCIITFICYFAVFKQRNYVSPKFVVVRKGDESIRVDINSPNFYSPFSRGNSELIDLRDLKEHIAENAISIGLRIEDLTTKLVKK